MFKMLASDVDLILFINAIFPKLTYFMKKISKCDYVLTIWWTAILFLFENQNFCHSNVIFIHKNHALKTEIHLIHVP